MAEPRGGAPLAILDYGMGNLRSVEKAFEKAGVAAVVTKEDETITAAPGLVLPGVGAFPRAMARIRERGLDELLASRVANGVPVLGICLGYQLLFEGSEEFGGDTGLGFVPGQVRRLEAPGLKVPHIGWEPVSWLRQNPLIEGIPSETAFYFVHSFAPLPDALEADGLGNARYGEEFCAAVAHGKVFGVQFHPEKSSSAGLRLLANFAALCPPA
jgi:glutamine amidotransferase